MLRVLGIVSVAILVGASGASSLGADAGAAVTQIRPDATGPSTCDLCRTAETSGATNPGIGWVGVAPGPPDTLQTLQVGDANAAFSISMGAGNSISQAQFGSHNASLVGVFADHATVDVVQAGDYLQSQLLVWGTPTSPIGVFQGPDSPPVNAAILTDRNGTTLIAPGNATVVIASK